MPAIYAIPRDYQPRQNNRVNYAHDIINYDGDNSYPQRVYEILMASSSGVACSNLYAKFICGNGFNDPDIAESVINFHGQTAQDLLKLIGLDYARFGCFALHVNYNLNYEISSITRIDPRYARMGLPDTGEYVSKIAIYNDWARDNYKIIKRKEIEHINVYNPNPEAVRKQIELAGGISEYKGQVLYYTGGSQGYARAPHDAILNDLEVDSKISKHSLTELDKGFMARQILKLPFEFEDDDERNKFKSSLQTVQGADGNSIFVLEANLSKEEQDVEMLSVDHTFTDLKFEKTKTQVRQDIYRNYNQPGILHTDYKQSGLSSPDQIETAFDFYNQHTSDEREDLLRILKGVLSYSMFGFDSLEDLEIVERRFSPNKANIAKQIGKDHTESLLNILQSGMPPEQKKQVLINVFGIDEGKADVLIDSGVNNLEENANIPNSSE